MLNLRSCFPSFSYYRRTRIGGKRVKRSLRTSYQRAVIVRAIPTLDSLMHKDLPSKYELDASRGILRPKGRKSMHG